LLSAGTDGTDGPTEAAGAVADSETVRRAISLNEDPEKYLCEFNSYSFFKRVGGLIVTGPTFTNVMDLIVVLVE
jgi:glycerate-2-kinase